MPTVRTFRDNRSLAPIPATQRRGVPVPQISTPQRSLPPDNGLERFGSQVTAVGLDILREEQRIREAELLKQDQVAVLEADRKLSEWENVYLHDPEQGQLNRKGKDSFGLPDQAREDFDKIHSEISEGLSSERQKDMFLRLAHTRRKDIDSTVSRHTAQQMQAFDNEETQAYIQNSQQAAIANAYDPVRIQTEIERQRIAIATHADRHGLGTEYIKQTTAQAVSGTHLGVIDRLLSGGQDRLAQRYFEEHKPEITGDSLAKVERALEEGSLTGESQRRSDRIMLSAETEEDAIAEARKITEPKLRDLTEARVKADWNMRKQRAREEKAALQETAAEAAQQAMQQALNLIDRTKPMFARDVVPPAVWAQLDAQDRGALETYVNRYQQTAGSMKTDQTRWYAMMREATENPDKFAKRNLIQDMPYLSESDFQEMAKLQRSIVNGKESEVNVVLDDFRTENQIIQDALGQMGIDAGKAENNAAVSRVRQMVGERVGILQRQTNKKATNEDVQAIVDDLVSQSVTIPGSWLGILPGGQPFFDTEKPLLDVTISDIPAAERRKIEEALRGANRPVTDATVLDLYIRTQQRQK